MALIAAALLFATGCAAFVFEEKIYDFLIARYEDRDVILTPDNQTDIIETYYQLSYIPDGFIMKDSVVLSNYASYHYKKDEAYIMFAQYTPSNFKFSIGSEDSRMYWLDVEGKKICCYEFENGFTYIFEIDEYVFSLVINKSELLQEENKEIIRGIVEKKL